MRSTLDLIWTQLDSPVDGVSECVMHVHRMMLGLHAKASGKGEVTVQIVPSCNVIKGGPRYTRPQAKLR